MFNASSLFDGGDHNDDGDDKTKLHCSINNCDIDHTILTSTIFVNMLRLEETYTITHDYFNTSTLKNRIDATMRSTLTTWMLEVCEEEQCTNDVFFLAVNIFDRFMCALNKCGTQNVEKYHLQLFGITCLFLAAKLKANTASMLNSIKLVDYTANSVTLGELLEWESIILDRLKWDIAAVCPNDYLEFFLHAYAPTNDLNLLEQIKKHSYAFTALCATEFSIGAFQPASMIASACFLTALNSVCSQDECNRIGVSLAELINADVDSLWTVREHVEDLFKRTQQQQQQPPQLQLQSQSQSNDFELINDQDLYDENCTYDELIKGFETESTSSSSSSNDKFFCSGGPFNITSDSLFDCINDLNLNDYDTEYVSIKKMDTKKKSKKSESSRSSVSSDSSGVSSGAASSVCSSKNTHNYLSYLNKSNCFQLTPPLANLLPMPMFDDEDTVTKKKKNTGVTVTTSGRRKQKLVLF
jgi:hypothetical protein